MASTKQKQKGATRKTRPKGLIGAWMQRRLKDLRTEAGATQTRVATGMTVLGLGWSKVTVADVERGVRKLSAEEAIALAILFQVRGLDFFIPDEPLEISEQLTIAPEELRELLLGTDGKLGHAGPSWTVAEKFAGSHILADALWEQRRLRSEEVDRLTASIANQRQEMARHLPDTELRDTEEDLSFKTVDGRLIIRRDRDGAIFALNPEPDAPGVIRYIVEKGRGQAVYFENGEEAHRLDDAGLPPELAVWN